MRKTDIKPDPGTPEMLFFAKNTGYLRKVAFFVAWFNVNDNVGIFDGHSDPVFYPVGKRVGFVNLQFSAGKEVKIDIFVASAVTGPQLVEPGKRECHSVDNFTYLTLYFIGQPCIHNTRKASSKDLEC